MPREKTTPTKLTPPELAQRWGVNPTKVLALIRSGELRAVNLATRPNGRPRYRIDLADVAAFESARSTVPAPKPRRRRADRPVREYV